MNSKEKANWLPSMPLLIKQLFISAISFLTLPCYKPKENGIQNFFVDNYYVKPDGLVFDGSTKGYYEKVKRVISEGVLNNQIIVDIGCGRGVFYFWLVTERYSVKKYIGIDFSIRDRKVDEKCFLYNDHAANINKYISEECCILFMSNVVCYLSDSIFKDIMCSLRKGDKIIIIEPSPNLFWDAHFCGIKPNYRNIRDMIRLIEDEELEVINTVQDYFMRIGRRYLFPVSYCIYATKK